MLLLIQSFQLSCYKFTKDLTFAFFFSADANLLTTWSALNSSFSISDFSRFLTFNFVFSISLSILVSEMVCFAFLQFLSCLFSGNSLIHSLRIDLHRYILHYFHLRYSRLRCSVRLHTDLGQKLSHLLLLLRRDSTLSYVLLQMGTANWVNLALPELSELC